MRAKLGVFLALVLIGAPRPRAADRYWDNDGVPANDWGSSANWSTIPGPADVAVFSAISVTTPQTVKLNGTRSVLGLSFTSSMVNSLLGGSGNQTLTLGTSGITVDAASAAATIGSATNGQNVSIILSGTQTWTNHSANVLTIQNGVSEAGKEAKTLTFAGAGNIAVVGTISASSGDLGVTKNGSGTVALSGSNTYNLRTVINAGVLSVGTLANGGTASGIGQSSRDAANLVLAGGTLQYTGTSASTDRNFTLSTGTTSAFDITTHNLTIPGASTATTGGLTKLGAGTVMLSGVNTYTGVTTFTQGIINAATLSDYGVAGSLGMRAVDVNPPISNVGLHFMGGTLQCTGATAQSTNRDIRVGLAGGTIDASGSVPSATMNFTKSTANVDVWDTDGGRMLTLTGSNTGNNTFAINWQERAAGHSSLVKSGAGTWVLTNPHNSDGQTDAYNAWGGYGGGTTLSGGTLGFVNNAIGGGVVDFTGNATLRWEFGNTQSSVPALNRNSRTSFSSERQGMSAASACPPTSPGRRWRCLAIGSILELIARFSLSV